MRRTIRANNRVTVALVALPDQFSLQAASLGMMTNTYSPGSAGVHSPGASRRGFVGDRGFGVNRWAGRAPHAVQNFGGNIAPITDPRSQRVGFGSGVAGQPGLPNTGDQTGGLSSLAWMSYHQLGRTGLGG